MNNKLEQSAKYAALIYAHIGQIFKEDCEYHIPLIDLEDADKCTAFFHALATAAPAILYNKLTHNDEDNLGFNHIANRLTFQFSNNDENN